MEDFERQLQKALQREEPPAWFEARVLAAVAAPHRSQSYFWRWAPVLAAGVVLFGGVVWQHEQSVQERVRGEAAKARLELALKIAGSQLHRIQQKVQAVSQEN